jgi:predicted methyltransferase MtxX (methanogen marker protein 4)
MNYNKVVKWAISSVTSCRRLADYGRHSETERMLVNNEGLAIPSLLKIQSGPLGNLRDSSGR